jgi:hypothetical protein
VGFVVAVPGLRSLAKSKSFVTTHVNAWLRMGRESLNLGRKPDPDRTHERRWRFPVRTTVSRRVVTGPMLPCRRGGCVVLTAVRLASPASLFGGPSALSVVKNPCAHASSRSAAEQGKIRH